MILNGRLSPLEIGFETIAVSVDISIIDSSKWGSRGGIIMPGIMGPTPKFGGMPGAG
jgi:hypothetical protein